MTVDDVAFGLACFACGFALATYLILDGHRRAFKQSRRKDLEPDDQDVL